MVCQVDTAAYIAKKGRGKGNARQGAGKKAGKVGLRRTAMSLHQRKARLARLKARAKCSACGQTGHWAGDPGCPKGKGKGGAKGGPGAGKGFKPMASVASAALGLPPGTWNLLGDSTRSQHSSGCTHMYVREHRLV